MADTATTPTQVHGDVAEGFGGVADAFRRGFTERGELGAAVSVVVDGRTVVDLWGGVRHRRTGAPWLRDTLVPVYSTTKGVSAAALALLHARGLLDHDRTVASYWPEFGARGKEQITVRQLLAHQAGLSHVAWRLDLATLADLDRLAAVLGDQAPAWTPGRRHGYHAISLGWYENELVRRVDPQGRSIGRFFAEEVAAPLGLELYIGVPDSVDRDRIARIAGGTRGDVLRDLAEVPRGFALAFVNPRSLTYKSLRNPPALGAMGTYNRPEVSRLELPGSNGTGQVRSIAALYGDLATGGRRLGLTSETFEALRRPATPPADGPRDLVLHVDTSYSLGYSRPTSLFRFGGAAGEAFGTAGAGGSFGFADPEHGVGFAYAPNRAGVSLFDDPRELALRRAVYRALGGRPQGSDGRLRRVVGQVGRWSPTKRSRVSPGFWRAR